MEAKLLLAIIAIGALNEGAATPLYEVSGGNLSVITGNMATFKCKITKLHNQTLLNLIPMWRDGAKEVLFFEERVVLADAKRMSISYIEDKEMVLRINDVVLSDEGKYLCSLSGIRPTVSYTNTLTVNQYPKQFYVQNLDVTPQDGEEVSVAKCITKGTKPEPKMWFTGPDDEIVALVDNPEVITRENGVVDKTITLKKTFTKSDNGNKYRCHVERVDSSREATDTAEVNVHFTPSVALEGVLQNYVEIQEEGNSLEVICVARGNPTPRISWTFTPDVNTNVTLPVGESLPKNWRSNGASVFSDSLRKSVEGLTNNGTFTCTADNGVGSPASVSFSLGVYAAPVTTFPTTTETTVVAEPLAGGSNGAVIGGVVAVAVFVIIVAVLLIARYFMSHKGTYRTKETKYQEPDENGDMAADEDEEFLAERKRTEYFL